MRVYFTRHGHTALMGPPDRFCGAGDPPLTKEGRQGVQQLADSLVRQLSPVVIYSSGKARAQESAGILGDALATPVVVADELEEIDFGEWEGLTKQEAEAQNPELYRQWTENPAAVTPPRGTSPREIARRAERFLGLIHAQRAPILVVAHKTFLRIALCTWLMIDLARYRSSFDICPATLGCAVFSGASCRLALLNWSPVGVLPGSG